MRLLLVLLYMMTVSFQTAANEGMWQPHQLPELQNELTTMGLKLDTTKISSFDEFPLNAIVSLGGCSASFVSPKGLVVTNHHCVYGSVVFNSTTKTNLLQNGFLAKNLNAEMPASPGTRVYVTEAMTDVTSAILAGVTESMSGLDRYSLIEKIRILFSAFHYSYACRNFHQTTRCEELFSINSEPFKHSALKSQALPSHLCNTNSIIMRLQLHIAPCVLAFNS